MNDVAKHRLVLPTSSPVKGPHFSMMSASELVVDYDAEQEDGSALWARVTFTGVLAFEYRDNTSCTAEDVEAYNCILIESQSDRLTEILALRGQFLGRFDPAELRGYRQYRVFFSDAGCIRVIARSFEEYDAPSAPDPLSSSCT